MAKSGAYDWRRLELKDWNATTFAAYLRYKHEERFGLPYVTNSYAAEARQIKSMYEEYGKEVVKDFIDECLRQYRPTAQYPTVSFFFMFSRMRERILPRVLKRHLSKKRQEDINSTTVDLERLEEMF
jgi:hypothetical protein